MYPRKSLSILLIISSLISNLSFAEEAVLLSKGEAAPYSGALLPVDKLQELRKAYLEKDSLSRSIELYKSNELLYTKKVDVLSEQNDRLAKTAYEERNMSTLEKIGYFGLGAILTGLVAYGIYRTK